MTHRVLVDARSTLLPRITGWERYSRELLNALQSTPVGSLIQVLPGSAITAFSRLLSDWVEIPEASREQIAFFPTFPPSHRTISFARSTAYVVHDLTWWRFPQCSSFAGRYYYKRMAEYALLNSTKIITVSDTVAAELRHFGLVADHTQITTIYPGVTPLRAGKEFINKRPYLLTVGTLEPRKNLPNLIRAFEKSGLSGDFDLLIIGRLAWGNVPAAKGVRVLNAATDETLGSAYSQAHGFICASLYEGFGLPVIEAAAAGLSVACSNIPVFHEVTSGRALFFDPLSENSIIGALRQLAYSQAPYVSDERYLLKYNWKRSASTLSSVLLDMC